MALLRTCPHCGFDLDDAWTNPTFRLDALDALRRFRHIDGACWRWTGRHADRNRCGRWTYKGTDYNPRTLAAVLLLGLAPANFRFLTLTCTTPDCFAPAHLRAGGLPPDQLAQFHLDLATGTDTATLQARYGVTAFFVRTARIWTAAHGDALDRLQGLIVPDDLDPLLAATAVLTHATTLRTKALAARDDTRSSTVTTDFGL